jgi:hypothetical protein
MKSRTQIILVITVIAVLLGYLTWSRFRRDIIRTIPEADVLLELKMLRDKGDHAKADQLLELRLRYMPELLTGKRIGYPFPPAEGVKLAETIEDYLANPTKQADTEHKNGH